MGFRRASSRGNGGSEGASAWGSAASLVPRKSVQATPPVRCREVEPVGGLRALRGLASEYGESWTEQLHLVFRER